MKYRNCEKEEKAAGISYLILRAVFLELLSTSLAAPNKTSFSALCTATRPVDEDLRLLSYLSEALGRIMHVVSWERKFMRHVC